jgi:D-apionolactonase
VGTQSLFELWYGRDEPPRQKRILTAGPIAVQLDGSDLRYVQLGELEVVRRVYIGVRDLNWNTIAGELTNMHIEQGSDSFKVQFEANHRQRDIDFSWKGTIVGSADGTISYEMDGIAQREFRYAKIGICIHHPIQGTAGRPFTGQTPDGPISGTLPLTIGPQIHLDDGTDLPLFDPVESMSIDFGEGIRVQFDFEGDLFEMEDQRNWTDASFKTSSTPYSLGYVHEAQAGKRIRQRVVIRIAGSPTSRKEQPESLRIELGDPIGKRLPDIGLGMASHGGSLSPREVELLRRLQLNHLRVDLHLRQSGYRSELARALDACQALNCGLELALFLDEEHIDELDELASLLSASSIPVHRVLVFHEREEVTKGSWVRLVRERLSPVLTNTAFAGGTNIYFNDINRHRPQIEAMDAISYSINPQIHAFDEASLVEALAGQTETVRSARVFCGNLPLIISPVTLKPRFNAVATQPEDSETSDKLPDQVDVRQMALFGAVWTLGSIKNLAESGVGSITYYETTGWHGVMETEAGSPLLDKFPSRPGEIFPIYHVLRDVGAWPSGELLGAKSSDPLSAEALVIRVDDATYMLVANTTPTQKQVTVGPLGMERVSVRLLDAESAPKAMRDPETFRSMTQPLPINGGELELELPPFALAWIGMGNAG